MTPSVEKLQALLKQLPGLGFRSAERVALHLLVEKPERLSALVDALQQAARAVRRCERCGNLAEEELCAVCADEGRDPATVCVVEQVPDLVAFERSGAYRGSYHVLHGKLSPIHGVGPQDLNLAALLARLAAGEIRELILALSNDVEGEATCHYITQHLPGGGMSEVRESAVAEDGLGGPESAVPAVKVTRIGFGLPSGGGVLYADSVTLKSALEGRRAYL
jgi:recombination protein RecR